MSKVVKLLGQGNNRNIDWHNLASNLEPFDAVACCYTKHTHTHYARTHSHTHTHTTHTHTTHTHTHTHTRTLHTHTLHTHTLHTHSTHTNTTHTNTTHTIPYSSYYTDHTNFIGVDKVYGPVAISLRHDKMEEDLPPTVGGPTIKHFYRIIIRTCQV